VNALTRTAQGGSVVDLCRSLAEPAAAELGLELFDVLLVREYGRLILRFIIDCEDGVTHQHCESFSRMIDPVLDAADPISASFYLEVSSPGVERPLRNEKEMKRFIGSPIRIIVNEVSSGEEGSEPDPHIPQVSRMHEGWLHAVENGVMTLMKHQEETLIVPVDNIKSAKLLLELPIQPVAKPGNKKKANASGRKR